MVHLLRRWWLRESASWSTGAASCLARAGLVVEYAAQLARPMVDDSPSYGQEDWSAAL